MIAVPLTRKCLPVAVLKNLSRLSCLVSSCTYRFGGPRSIFVLSTQLHDGLVCGFGNFSIKTDRSAKDTLDTDICEGRVVVLNGLENSICTPCTKFIAMKHQSRQGRIDLESFRNRLNSFIGEAIQGEKQVGNSIRIVSVEHFGKGNGCTVS